MHHKICMNWRAIVISQGLKIFLFEFFHFKHQLTYHVIIQRFFLTLLLIVRVIVLFVLLYLWLSIRGIEIFLPRREKLIVCLETERLITLGEGFKYR